MPDVTLSLQNPVFSRFVFYGGAVLLKTIVMSILTARLRISRKIFITPEDYTPMGQGKKPEKLTVDQDVERVRRCHLNDLENVLPFTLLGLLYVLTGPELATATLVFRLFAGSRIAHTLAYLIPIPQPSRALCFFIGLCVNIYMAVSLLRAGTM